MLLYFFGPRGSCLAYLRTHYLKILEISNQANPLVPVNGKLEKPIGMISFYKSWRNPLLWSQYADNHRGLALGFEVDPAIAVRVRYPLQQPLFPQPNGQSTRILHTTKPPKLSYQQEYVVWAELDAPDQNGMYFRRFDSQLQLREVIAGCLSNVSEDEVRAELGDYDQPVPFIRTRLDKKTLQIYKQRSIGFN